MSTIVHVRNNFRNDLGNLLDPDQLKYVHSILCWFIGELRVLHDQCAAALDRAGATREPSCASCALAPATDDWEGFNLTIWNVIRAFLKMGKSTVCGGAFMCHQGHEWRDRKFRLEDLKPCNSYLVLHGVAEDQAVELARQAFEAICLMPPPADRVNGMLFGKPFSIK